MSEAIKKALRAENQDAQRAALLAIAETDPRAALNYAELYEGTPYAAAVIEVAARKAAETDTEAAFFYADLYEGTPYAAVVIEAAARKAAETNPRTALDSAYLYKGTPYAAAVIETAARKAVETDPEAALIYAKLYADTLYAAAVIEAAAPKAAETAPGAALKYAKLYADMPYAAEVIEAAAHKAAETDPGAALDYAELYADMPYAAAVIEAAARKAAETDPRAALFYAELYTDTPYAAAVIEAAARKAAETDPLAALNYAELHEDTPYAAAVIEAAARKAAETHPEAALIYAKLYADMPYAAAVIEAAARKAAEADSEATLFIAYFHMDTPYAAAVIEAAAPKAAETAPDVAFFYADLYKGTPYAAKVIETAAHKAAETAPGAALKYAKLYADMPYAAAVIEAAAHKAVEIAPGAALSYAEFYEGTSYAAAVIEAAAHKAAETDPVVALEHAELYEDTPYAAEVRESALESKQGALYAVTRINELHDAPDVERFALVKGINAQTLYHVISNGRAEVFTSSYNGLLNRFLQQLKKQDTGLLDVINATDQSKASLVVFMEAAAAYGRLDDLLNISDAAGTKQIADEMVKAATQSDNFNYTIALSDFVAVASSGSKNGLMQEIGKQLRATYDKARSEDNQSLQDKIGLVISSLNDENMKKIPEADKAFFLGIKNNPRFALPDLSSLKQDEITIKGSGGKPTHNQLHAFYDDEDGHLSYNNFLKRYQQNPKQWKIEDHDGHLIIRSQASVTDVVLYVDKPDDSQNLEELKAAYPDIAYHAVIHRGHSYHADKTVDEIGAAAKFVFLGSCGGYHEISEVLKRAPEAHIIATKGTGSYTVNDPLLFEINTRLSRGEDISWKPLWEKAVEPLGSGHKAAYVAPNENRAALLQARYNELASGVGDQGEERISPDLHHSSNAVHPPNRAGNHR